jgi:hypothetical protein
LDCQLESSLVLLCAVFWFGWWISQRSRGLSPYTGIPLRKASDLSFFTTEKIFQFLLSIHQYDNRIFKLNRAAFCRETGRVFQDCINWFDIIHVDWNFLTKRHPGYYISWGSLTHELQKEIRDAHDSLEGFQTAYSSPSPAPRMIEPEYAYTKPGPLYVDIQTKILIGWKVVPGTDLEVLIVKKPLNEKK